MKCTRISSESFIFSAFGLETRLDDLIMYSLMFSLLL